MVLPGLVRSAAADGGQQAALQGLREIMTEQRTTRHHAPIQTAPRKPLMTLRATHRLHTVLPALLLALTLGTAWAQQTPRPAAMAAAPASAVASASRLVIRSNTLPGPGLFEGDRLSDTARARLDAMLAQASDLDVEVVLLVPAGPWRLDGQPGDERSLTPARLAALRQHLVQRGLPAKRIYVESRIEPSATVPRLVVELVGRPAPQ